MIRTPSRGRFTKSASTLLLSALIVFVSLLGSSPALHKWIHADSNTVEHSCAITLFTKGQVDAAAVAPSVAGFITFYDVPALLSEAVQFPFFTDRFSRGRAPPLHTSSLLG